MKCGKLLSKRQIPAAGRHRGLQGTQIAAINKVIGVLLCQLYFDRCIRMGVQDGQAGQDLVVEGPLPECPPEFEGGKELFEFWDSFGDQRITAADFSDSLLGGYGRTDAGGAVGVSSCL